MVFGCKIRESQSLPKNKADRRGTKTFKVPSQYIKILCIVCPKSLSFKPIWSPYLQCVSSVARTDSSLVFAVFLKAKMRTALRFSNDSGVFLLPDKPYRYKPEHVGLKHMQAWGLHKCQCSLFSLFKFSIFFNPHWNVLHLSICLWKKDFGVFHN